MEHIILIREVTLVRNVKQFKTVTHAGMKSTLDVPSVARCQAVHMEDPQVAYPLLSRDSMGVLRRETCCSWKSQ